MQKVSADVTIDCALLVSWFIHLLVFIAMVNLQCCYNIKSCICGVCHIFQRDKHILEHTCLDTILLVQLGCQYTLVNWHRIGMIHPLVEGAWVYPLRSFLYDFAHICHSIFWQHMCWLSQQNCDRGCTPDAHHLNLVTGLGNPAVSANSRVITAAVSRKLFNWVGLAFKRSENFWPSLRSAQEHIWVCLSSSLLSSIPGETNYPG